MAFRIVYRERARKDLRKIPAKWREKLLRGIENLAQDPFQGKKLQGGLKGLFSLRIWPYRVIYQVMKKEILIIVLHVGHRQGVYKS